MTTIILCPQYKLIVVILRNSNISSIERNRTHLNQSRGQHISLLELILTKCQTTNKLQKKKTSTPTISLPKELVKKY